MTELEQVLAGDSAHTPPPNILDQLPSDTAHQKISGAPHTIYEELWHIAYWQQVTLDWVNGIETPIPDHASAGFPAAQDEANEDEVQEDEAEQDKAREDWDHLRQRFFQTSQQAIAIARDVSRLDVPVRCPSRPGMPVRVMTIRDQLESLGAHNAYHFGRIVLLRQMLGKWPPPSGGFTW